MQDDNGKAPPIIGSNRLTVLKPEMSSSPFKYDPLFQSGGENSVFENINNSQPCTNMKTQRQALPFLKAVYLAPQQRSHQGRALERLFFLFSSPLRLQSHLEEDLEGPFVASPWNKTNRIQVFWLALSRASRQRLPAVAWARSCDSKGNPDTPIFALKSYWHVWRGCLPTFISRPNYMALKT